MIVDAAAADDELLELVASGPEASQYPLLVLAAVHLVLAGELPELAAVYRGDRPVDAAPRLFRAALLGHSERILDMLETRFVQTNECGRASPPALGLAAGTAAVGEPVALVDAGASAGLNLLDDRFRLDVGDQEIWGDPKSPVAGRVLMVEGPSVLGYQEWQAIDDAHFQDTVTAAVEYFMQEGTVTTQPVDPVVRVLLTISNALGTLISSSDEPNTTREVIEPVWAQLLNGLRTPGGGGGE